MALVDPFEDSNWFDDFTDEVNRLLTGGKFPPITISIKDNHFLIRAELPGIDANDLNITVAERSVNIQGERNIEPSEGVISFHGERKDGAFSRNIALPKEVDTSKAESLLSNGILTITLPKKESAASKQITVKAGR
jgi:HSP20 family protein